MFEINVNKNTMDIVSSETLTSGSVNIYQVQFNFSEDWDGLTKTVTFRAGERTMAVILDDTNVCTIPWEVTVENNVDLYVGVRGIRGNAEGTNEVVLPTIWARLGLIRKGTETEVDPPNPDVYDKIIAEIADLQENKQDKLKGTEDQIVGFDAEGNAIPVDKPVIPDPYDDTEIRAELAEVKSEVNDLSDDIDSLEKATDDIKVDVQKNESAIATLNGTGAGSVKKAVADGIAEVVAGAPESLDTLKEISDWIENHSESAAAMNSQIQTNSANISVLQNTVANQSDLITANSAAISENSEEIASNYEEIQKNAQDITKNAAAITLKQDKLSGTPDQIVGFDTDGNAVPVAKSSGGESYDDTEIKEDIADLQDTKQDKLSGTPDQIVGFDDEGNAVPVAKPTGGGSDGITPHIGENGNWWLADTDTGVPATGPQGPAATIEAVETITGEAGTNAYVENVGNSNEAKLKFTIPKGADGENGLTPHIGENGNWWIGDVDTGNPSQGEQGIPGQDAAPYDDSEIKEEIASLQDIVDMNTDDIADVKSAIADKQDKLTPGTGIDITNNVISAEQYDDSEIKADIAANTAAIAVLNGTGAGSVKKTVDDAIAEIVADAPEDFDTLKEMSDWISSHANSAAAMNSEIIQNTEDITAIQNANTAQDTLIAENSEAIESLAAEVAEKQNKLTGTTEQIVGFDEDGNAVAVEKPSGGNTYDDTEIRELIDTKQDKLTDGYGITVLETNKIRPSVYWTYTQNAVSISGTSGGASFNGRSYPGWIKWARWTDGQYNYSRVVECKVSLTRSGVDVVSTYAALGTKITNVALPYDYNGNAGGLCLMQCDLYHYTNFPTLEKKETVSLNSGTRYSFNTNLTLDSNTIITIHAY